MKENIATGGYDQWLCFTNILITKRLIYTQATQAGSEVLAVSWI